MPRPTPRMSTSGQADEASPASSTYRASSFAELSSAVPAPQVKAEGRTWADVAIPLETAEQLEHLAHETGREPGDLIAEAIRIHYGNLRQH